MTITVKAARDALELAQAAYLAADIEHPTQAIIAKSALNQARMNYWACCAELTERLAEENDPMTLYYQFREETL